MASGAREPARCPSPILPLEDMKIEPGRASGTRSVRYQGQWQSYRPREPDFLAIRDEAACEKSCPFVEYTSGNWRSFVDHFPPHPQQTCKLSSIHFCSETVDKSGLNDPSQKRCPRRFQTRSCPGHVRSKTIHSHSSGHNWESGVCWSRISASPFVSTNLKDDRARLAKNSSSLDGA